MTDKNYDKALKWIQRNGFSEIKAKAEGFEAPNTLVKQKDGEAFVPDMTGQNRFGKYYFEIVDKKETTERRKVTKWKLMNTLAAMKGGKLVLFAPKGNKSFTQKLVKDHNLSAQVIYIPTI